MLRGLLVAVVVVVVSIGDYRATAGLLSKTTDY
jgi:hypothetical protein